MKKIQIFILCWLASSAVCFAQSGVATFSEINEKGPQATQLFQLNPEHYNNHFDFTLPDNGKLMVDFLRLSDWGKENQLQAIAATAAEQVRLLQDSFSGNYSSKLLALNIPVNGKIISVRYDEDKSAQKQLAYKDGSYYQLKTGFDTIRIIKNMGLRTKPLVDSGIIQVQYTFILKDINDIQTFSANPEILQQIGLAADSAIERQRKRWHQEDARHHTLRLIYDPRAPQPMTSDVEDGPVLSFIAKNIKMYLAVGFGVYTGNNVSPYFDEGISYLLPSRGRMQPFVGLNMTLFGLLNTNGISNYYYSYNLEYGLCKKGMGFMQQKTSITLGLMQKYNSPQKIRLFHMGFNFGFNSFLSGGFGFATDFKKDSPEALIIANFKFNL